MQTPPLLPRSLETELLATGHLFLMMSLVEYFVLTGINFVPTLNPGSAPDHPTPHGTPAEIADRVCLNN